MFCVVQMWLLNIIMNFMKKKIILAILSLTLYNEYNAGNRKVTTHYMFTNYQWQEKGVNVCLDTIMLSMSDLVVIHVWGSSCSQAIYNIYYRKENS